MDDVRHETIDTGGLETRAVPTEPLLGVSPGSWDQPSPAVPDRAALDSETHRLLDFAAGTRSPGGGFASLDSDGLIVDDGLVDGLPERGGEESVVELNDEFLPALGVVYARDFHPDRVVELLQRVVTYASGPALPGQV